MAQTVNKCYLIADNRERHVFDDIESVLAGAWERKQLTCGDYLVMCGDRIVACIERKTLDDFGASVIDDRHENKAKLIELRRRTGCQLYYLVEGPAFPSKETIYGGIPFSTIQAIMMRLMMRDGIFILQSRDKHYTAEYLRGLVRAAERMSVLGGSLGGSSCSASDIESKSADAPAGALTVVDVQSAPGTCVQSAPAGQISDLELAMTIKLERTDRDRAIMMWRATGLTDQAAGQIKFSIADLILGRVEDTQINLFRSQKGRRLVKAINIFRALASAPDTQMIRRIVAAAPGWGPKTADDVTLALFCEICNVQRTLPVIAGKRKVPPSKVAELRRLANFKY